MKSKSTITLLLLFFATSIFAQAPVIEWEKSLGGTLDEDAFDVQQTKQGKYVAIGSTYSTDGDVVGLHGSNYDFWFTELNSNGALIMQKCLGGSFSEVGYSVVPLSKGGFALSGESSSNDGDVQGDHHGSLGPLPDYWVTRMTKQGNIKWAKSYGGSNFEQSYDMVETPEGGLVIAGYSESTDGDVTGNHGGEDFWIVKTNATGDLIWQKCYGGSGRDVAYAIVATDDNGYVVAGFSSSTDGDVEGQHGGYDFWIIKINDQGQIIWKKALGGKFDDVPEDIKETIDGGFIISGWSSSNDGDVSNNHGNYDYWVVRLDKDGNMIWEQALGGSSVDFSFGVDQTTDGGFIVTGCSSSSDGNVSYNHGGDDFWVVKLKKSGNIEWEKSLGGSEEDRGWRVRQTMDGGYILAGESYSNDGDVTGHHGTTSTSDFWIVKLSSQSPLKKTVTAESTSSELLNVYPNPSNDAFTIEESFNDVPTEFAKINLFNANGVLVYQTRVSVCDGKLNMTITPDADLPKGVYLLQTILNNHSSCQTIIRD